MKTVMEAFDPDQSEASLFVGTYRVVQQDLTLFSNKGDSFYI